MSPGFRCRSVLRSPVRMAGPWVSIRMATARPSSSAMERMRGTISRTQSCCAWLMLSRKTLAPSCTNCRSVSAFSLAGPSVQIILVLRISSICFGYSRFIFPPRRKGKIKTARMTRQIWTVIGIAQNLRAPFFLHVTGFAEQLLSIVRIRIATAGRGLVVDQICIRGPDNEPTTFTQTQTKIDVVEISGEILIEAVEIGENVFARYHAGSGDGGSILRQHESPMHRP